MGSGSFCDAPPVSDVYVRRLREKIEPDPENPMHLKTVRGAGYLFEPVRRNLFANSDSPFSRCWSVLLARVAYFAERALRRDYERTAILTTNGYSLELHRPARSALPALPPSRPEDLAKLKEWMAEISASHARITIIGNDGQVFADSQSTPQTMEKSRRAAGSSRSALAKGGGRSIRPQRHG